jgi:DNA polymerase III epsilon subunit-like protein
MNWAERFVSFDTETTGFDSKARIIELACVLFENGEPTETFETYLLPPDVDWNDKNVLSALEVNKINPKDLEGKPSFGEIFHHIYLAFNGAPVWVAHNAEFDLRMLDQEYGFYKGGAFPVKPEMACLCTMSLSRSIHPDGKRHRLEDTAARWGVAQDGAHRAASDAIACGRILSAMSKGHLPSDLAQVHELQTQANASWNSRRGRR